MDINNNSDNNYSDNDQLINDLNNNDQNFKIKKNNIESVIKDNEINTIKNLQLLPDQLVGVLIGKPNSGKSFLIRELLLNNKLYKKHFSYVFIFSPYKIKDLQCDLGTNYFNIFSIEKIYELIKKYNKAKRILFIFDDFINQLKKLKDNPELQALFYNRRHLLANDGVISFLITTQKYYQFPSTLRTCITQLYIFDVNKKELSSINGDIGIIEQKKLAKIMLIVAKKDNSHLLINLENYKMFINFDEIIF